MICATVTLSPHSVPVRISRAYRATSATQQRPSRWTSTRTSHRICGRTVRIGWNGLSIPWRHDKGKHKGKLFAGAHRCIKIIRYSPDIQENHRVFE